MTLINLLRFTKKVETRIDGHFILKLKDNFMVFTSKPVNGIKCHKVSDKNIKGQNKPQYIAEKTHNFDSSIHKITKTNECNAYYNENKKELLPFEQKLQLISENNNT